MKIVYLDTCIIISYLKKDDKFHNISKIIMNASNLERIDSQITLIEIASVISRQFENIKFNDHELKGWEELNPHEKKATIILYLIEQLSINFYVNLGTEKLNLKNQDFKINIDFSKAFQIAPLFSLRTLDNLQLAACLNLKNVKNLKIDYFITSDELILNQSKIIQKLVDLTVIHPEKLIEIEHL
ncbi:MAG: PIN domain-containing protein [Candidatus Lokiarchaeota archaeon]|nr:PIN domain-containing protein [Candidatus Lokiarchaeota archaeon]